MTRSSTLRSPVIWFPALVLALYGGVAWIALHLSAWERPDVMAWAVTFDLVITVPLLFHFLVGRPRRYPVLRSLPLVILGALAARVLLPEAHDEPARVVGLLTAPLELVVLGWIVLRLRRAWRSGAEAASDPLQRLRTTAEDLTGSRRAAEFVVADLGVFRYAFARRGERAHVPAGAGAFTQHVESGQGGLVFGFIMLLAAEGLAVHFLLAHWNEVVAWIFTASSVYAALWMIADWRATGLRPLLVDGDALRLRVGLRWEADIPLARVVAVHREAPDVSRRERAALPFLAPPTRWLELREPAVLRGPFGTRKTVRWIGLAPDDPAAFEAALGAES